MKIMKAINNNAALGLDDCGKDVVILGNGVGFPKMPYVLTDLSKIKRIFYDVNPKYTGITSEIPEPILLASADIAEYAKRELDCELNPNLTFTLADHLNFAIIRIKKGLELSTPLAYDVSHLYPKESIIGKKSLEILKDYTGDVLPDSEITSIALHIINAEIENGNMDSALMSIKILSDITNIIEQNFGIQLDVDSFYFSRFHMHIRYLIQRLENGGKMTDKCKKLLKHMIDEFPDVYECVMLIVHYFEQNWGWKCNDDEIVYLMVHLNRIREKNN